MSAQALALRAKSVAQLLVEDVCSPQLLLENSHHLLRVLRANDGEKVVAVDGSGNWALCVLQDGQLVRTGEPAFEPRRSLELAVAFPFLKGDNTELIVQKLTELGIERMQLLEPQHGSVRVAAAKLQKVITRLQKVATEASMQSRAVRVPEILAPVSVTEVIDNGYSLAQWDGELFDAWFESLAPLRVAARNVTSPSEAAANEAGPQQRVAVAIGPEGGWSEAEVQAAAQTGRNGVALGGNILRAETAAIAAGALLATRRAFWATQSDLSV